MKDANEYVKEHIFKLRKLSHVDKNKGLVDYGPIGKFPIIGQHIVTIFVSQYITIETVSPAKGTLNYRVRAYNLKTSRLFSFNNQILISRTRRSFS